MIDLIALFSSLRSRHQGCYMRHAYDQYGLRYLIDSRCLLCQRLDVSLDALTRPDSPLGFECDPNVYMKPFEPIDPSKAPNVTNDVTLNVTSTVTNNVTANVARTKPEATYKEPVAALLAVRKREMGGV